MAQQARDYWSSIKGAAGENFHCCNYWVNSCKDRDYFTVKLEVNGLYSKEVMQATAKLYLELLQKDYPEVVSVRAYNWKQGYMAGGERYTCAAQKFVIKAKKV